MDRNDSNNSTKLENSENSNQHVKSRVNFGLLIGGLCIIVSAISMAFNLEIWSYIGQYAGPIVLSLVGVWLIIKSVKK